MPLSDARNTVSEEPLPSEQAVTAEEVALLWRALERLPEPYREPLVLFYRHDQSIALVAEELELSEDAVKQRLSRGRRLLQEQFLALAQDVLQKTNPTDQFTLNVMAALPAIAATGSATAVAAKTSPATKTLVAAAGAGAVIWLIVTFAILGALIAMGVCFGYVMVRSIGRSARVRQRTAVFWKVIALSSVAFIVGPFIVASLMPGGAALHPRVYTALSLIVALFYPTVFVAIAWWWAAWRKPEMLPAPASEPIATMRRWIVLGALVPAFGFIYIMYTMGFRSTLMSARLNSDAARQIIATRADANYTIIETDRDARILEIRLPEDGRRVVWQTLLDEPTQQAMKQNRRSARTLVEGRDYGQLGWPWLRLTLMAFFLGPLGLFVSGHQLWSARGPLVLIEAAPHSAERRAARWFNRSAVITAIVVVGVLSFAIGVTLLHR